MSIEIGTGLRAWRDSKGLTQLEVAMRVGCNPNHICNYEVGRHTPTMARANAIAEALGITLDELIAGPSATAQAGR